VKTWLLALALAVALVANAGARIDLFLKEGGVSDYVFDTAPRNYLPYFDGAASAEVALGQHIYQPTPLDRTVFFWGRFVSEPVGATLFGLMPSVTLTVAPQGAPNITVNGNAVYRHQKLNGPIAERWVRWDGTNALQFNGPVAAVTRNGILNDATNVWDLVADYGDPDSEAMFLLGAFRITSFDAPIGVLTIGLGPLGLAAHDSTHSYYPEVRVGHTIVQEYWGGTEAVLPGTIPGTPTVYPGPAYLTYIPEPAAVWPLLTLAASLLGRGRRSS
jgi:hypothetical protein